MLILILILLCLLFILWCILANSNTKDEGILIPQRRRKKEGDADRVRILRILMETAQSHYNQGIISEDQYNDIANYVAAKLEELEETYHV